METQLKKPKHPYGYVANAIINDKTLSFNAKGIYLYILSKPDNWDFSQKRISQDSTTSEFSVRKAIKELEDADLLERVKQSDGRVVYLIKDPVTDSTIAKSQKSYSSSGKESQKTNTQHADSQLANPEGISNTDIKVIKNNTSNKESTALAESKPKEITPKENTADFFSNTQRQTTLAKAISEKYNADFSFISQEMQKFVLYWTEPLQSGRKVRWETEKAFEIQRRLATWFGRVKTFNKTTTPLKRERKIWK